ncbi:hypothetical protein [Candidatus Liberibacter americanus]|uniref:Uncharacterized protein n=1 Tax=Candidatus Liberibacter americanus str. Sao Paulo TaxID=1261131 RepID=U6B893_9HYPH|nr:hypothetical protein [Candidatus Liberibacter americanus]AHA28086.1 hypothetical protein lam_739 [Candidatus Liberibacter americanus str. Sao Paulo]
MQARIHMIEGIFYVDLRFIHDGCILFIPYNESDSTISKSSSDQCLPVID